jgi:hypothetical protein
METMTREPDNTGHKHIIYYCDKCKSEISYDKVNRVYYGNQYVELCFECCNKYFSAGFTPFGIHNDLCKRGRK